jgi:polyphosphate kinase
MVPVEDAEARGRIAEIIDIMLDDDRRSWQLGPNATWRRTEEILGHEGTCDTHDELKARALAISTVAAAPHRPRAGAGSLDPRA